MSAAEKQCRGCLEVLPLTSFHRKGEGKSKDGLQPKCKDCVRAYQVEYLKKNRERKRAYDKQRFKDHRERLLWQKRETKWGLTIEQYGEMVERQGGACAICGRPFAELTGAKNTPHVDHCHSSGVIRGILCQNCNVGLGQFKDSPDILAAAAAYLTVAALEAAHV